MTIYRSINALAETVNGYYKTELVRGPARPGPWRTVEDLELATLGWVSWHNTQRLHGYLGDVPPAEFEDTFYAVEAGREQLVGIKQRESPSDPGRFTPPLPRPRHENLRRPPQNRRQNHQRNPPLPQAYLARQIFKTLNNPIDNT